MTLLTRKEHQIQVNSDLFNKANEIKVRQGEFKGNKVIFTVTENIEGTPYFEAILPNKKNYVRTKVDDIGNFILPDQVYSMIGRIEAYLVFEKEEGDSVKRITTHSFYILVIADGISGKMTTESYIHEIDEMKKIVESFRPILADLTEEVLILEGKMEVMKDKIDTVLDGLEPVLADMEIVKKNMKSQEILHWMGV